MCLIVFSYKEHPDFPFIFAGNRDEFYARPARAARFWEDHPHLLGGRDLQAGGTWLGVTSDGRFATVTNYREPARAVPNARSRGELVTDFLVGDDAAPTFVSRLKTRAQRYGGFNLIFGNRERLYYYSNRGLGRDASGGDEPRRGDTADQPASGGTRAEHGHGRDANGGSGGIEPVAIAPGLHGLSNERLNTPWPKVRRAKMLMREIIEGGEFEAPPLLSMLADTARPPEDELPSTGIEPEWERALSSIFVQGEIYGTRASTVVLVRADGLLSFTEKTYGPGGRVLAMEEFEVTTSENGG